MSYVIEEELLMLLVEKSERLFQWAYTACSFVRGLGGLTVKEAIFRLINNLSKDGASPLDNLYADVLRLTFPNDDTELMERFRSVMSLILCATQPLSINALHDIRRHGTGGNSNEVTPLIQKMGAVLSGVSSTTEPIRPLHTSFRDFLTTESRGRYWYINSQEGHDIMLLGSVRIMNQCLKFNICELGTSYRRNADLGSTTVSESLSYAARYWADHLSKNSNLTIIDVLRAEMNTFLHQKLLNWLELLSILRRIHLAAQSLNTALMLFEVGQIWPSFSSIITSLIVRCRTLSAKANGPLLWTLYHLYGISCP
jgi:hypothetical protein